MEVYYSYSRDPFVELNEKNVVVFWLLCKLIEYSHHAVNEGNPEIFGIQGIPEMAFFGGRCDIHVAHFEQFEGGSFKFEVAFDSMVIEQLL